MSFPLYKSIRLNIRKQYPTDRLKVTSLRKKMTEEKKLTTNKTDIYLISETKLDQSFPNQLFQINFKETGTKMLEGFYFV